MTSRPIAAPQREALACLAAGGEFWVMPDGRYRLLWPDGRVSRLTHSDVLTMERRRLVRRRRTPQGLCYRLTEAGQAAAAAVGPILSIPPARLLAETWTTRVTVPLSPADNELVDRLLIEHGELEGDRAAALRWALRQQPR